MTVEFGWLISTNPPRMRRGSKFSDFKVLLKAKGNDFYRSYKDVKES